MFLSFFKTAIRFLWRNKTYSILNFLCLTFGLTCSTLAFLHIRNVLSYDKFQENSDRLFLVEANITYFNGDRFPKEVMSASLKDVLENVPEIESVIRVVNDGNTFVYDSLSFNASGIYADSNFLKVFTFPLKSGNIGNALSEVNSIVVSEKMAEKFFGSGDCTGKSLVIKKDDKQEAYTITGVLKETESPSYLRFDYIIPFSKFLYENSWASETGASACQVWALLSAGTDRQKVDSRIKDLIRTQESTLNQELFLFPLKEKVLYNYVGGRRIWAEMQYLVITGSLGLAILLIACFNFINLAIAMNIRRYREAGIRKVAGAGKMAIILQYLGETFILTIICLIVSIDITGFLVEGFNTRFGADIGFSLGDPGLLIFFIAVTLFTGLVSGLLPGIYLSSSNPTDILKRKLATGNSFSKFRQGLIIFQFTIPIILIICMLIIKVEDRYIRNYDLGFNRKDLVIINTSARLNEHEDGVRSDLMSLPGIESASFSNCLPATNAKVTNDVTWEGKDPAQKLHFWCIATDYGYSNAVNLKITQGRYFDRSFVADSACYVINDVAAGLMKYDDPVGRQFTLEGRKGTIIGVFRDYHTVDLSGPYTPTIITIRPDQRNYLLISTLPGSFRGLKDQIGDMLKKYDPELEYIPQTFEDLKRRTELTTTSNLIGVAFIIALLLACLGLSGLASFTVESRTKEIGIRKASGGTTFSIMRLLCTNYTKWLFISTVIAIPIAFLLGNIFMKRFNFNPGFPVWTLIAGPVISYIISLSSIGLKSWRAASKNPVEALRYE